MSDNNLEQLLDDALTATDRDQRRVAFLAVLRSDDWRQVLAPHVISKQGYVVRQVFYPDWLTFERSAEIIAQNDERIQQGLELAGTRFSGDLLLALARHMGPALVEHVLSHLRTADRMRAGLLIRVLTEAQSDWIKRPEAFRVARRLLRTADEHRVRLLQLLANVHLLHQIVDELKQYPPQHWEEWHALGVGGLEDDAIFQMGLAILPHNPSPLLYLLRVPNYHQAAIQRMMESARTEWLSPALEVAMVGGLSHPALLPLAELAIRMGGRSMQSAMGWLGSSKLARELLVVCTKHIKRNKNGKTTLSDALIARRSADAPSSDRALELSRKGQAPKAEDVAALIRQVRGERITDLTEEILIQARPAMFDHLLRPLCAVHQEAANMVASFAQSPDPAVAAKAQKAMKWPDIAWPDAT